MGADDDLRSPASLAKPSAAFSSSPLKSPVPQATLFTPSSAADKKLISLFDWWLIEVEQGFEGKNLAVSGFTTRQKATRLFKSAPIVKRRDAYTLETADGITVKIQGMINKARTQDNGFPVEICNYFLIGFPYNWSYYAGEYVRKISASRSPRNLSSLDIASICTDETGCTFPVRLNEFPIGSFLNSLPSAGKNWKTNCSDHLKNFFRSTSVDSKMQKSPPSLPTAGLGRHNVDQSDRNVIVSPISVEHVSEDHSAHCSQQIECYRNNLNEGNASRIMLCEQERVGMKKRTSLTINTKEMETGNQLVSFISVNHDDIAHVHDSAEAKLDAEVLNNSAGEGGNEVLDSPLIKASDVLHGEQVDDTVGRQHCYDKPVFDNTDITNGSLVFLGLDSKSSNSLKGETDVTLEDSPHYNVIKSLQTRDWQKKSVRTGYLNGELGELDYLNMSKHNSTGNIAESPLDEINDMCRSILEKIKSCNILSVGNSIAQKCSTVDIKLTTETEMDFSQKEILVDVIGKQVRKQDSIQKPNQKCTEGIRLKDFISSSASNGPLDEDKLTGTDASPGTEGQLSTVEGHNYPYLDGICTRSGRKLSSPYIFSRSECPNYKSVSSSKTNVKRVRKKNEAVSTSLETSENRKNHLIYEGKGLTSFTEGHDFVKYGTKDTSSSSSAQDLASLSENCTYDLSVKGLSLSDLQCSQKQSSLFSCATTKELQEENGLTTDDIYMENIHESGILEKIKTRSDIPDMVHSSKDKSLDMTGKKSVKKISNQGLKEPKVSVAEEPNKNKGLHACRRRKMWTQTSYVHESPLTRDKAKKLSMASPESLNLRRSTSGRVIVPPLDNGCQQIIYDADGSVTGIIGVDLLSSPIKGSKLEPAKRRKI